jgi:hypothetical protein
VERLAVTALLELLHRRRSSLLQELATERAACQERVRRDLGFLKLAGAGLRAANALTGRPLLRTAAIAGLAFALTAWRGKQRRTG